jgi:hypothetical protein
VADVEVAGAVLEAALRVGVEELDEGADVALPAVTLGAHAVSASSTHTARTGWRGVTVVPSRTSS